MDNKTLTDKTYLAFDLGASSGRAILGHFRDGRLELEEIHRFPNYPYEKDGHYFWNFHALVKELETGLQKAAAAAPGLSSFSIDTWGVDYCLFRGGKPVHDPYCYRDGRTETERHDFHRYISYPDYYRRNGIQPLVFNTLYQLYDDRRHHPEDLEGSRMLLMPDALHYMLTGTMSSELTIASTTAMIHHSYSYWDTEALTYLAKFPKSIFTDVVHPATAAGMLTSETAERLGVPRFRAVKCASHDTASAVLAMPCPDPAKALYISLGTWALLGSEQKDAFIDNWVRCEGFTNERGINNTFRLLVNIMGTWLLQETKRTWNEQGKDYSFADMERMAAPLADSKFRIDPDDQLFFPPGDMPARIREFCAKNGQGEIPSDAALVRCIYDSLAECFRKKLDMMEAIVEKKFDNINILGGGTRDRFFMQLTANTTGRRVIAGPTEATAIGNLLAQMLCDGTLKSVAEARALVAASFPLETFEPIV